MTGSGARSSGPGVGWAAGRKAGAFPRHRIVLRQGETGDRLLFHRLHAIILSTVPKNTGILPEENGPRQPWGTCLWVNNRALPTGRALAGGPLLWTESG